MKAGYSSNIGALGLGFTEIFLEASDYLTTHTMKPPCNRCSSSYWIHEKGRLFRRKQQVLGISSQNPAVLVAATSLPVETTGGRSRTSTSNSNSYGNSSSSSSSGSRRSASKLLSPKPLKP